MSYKNPQTQKNLSDFYDQKMEEHHFYGGDREHEWAGNAHRYRVKLLSNIFSEIGVTSDTEILDIACCDFELLGRIFPPASFPKITATDISRVALDKAKKNFPYVEFLLDNAEDPDVKKEFDVVFAGEIIEHLKDPAEALKNWVGLVKPGGYLIVTTPNKLVTLHDLNGEHISLMHVGQMKNLLVLNGLSILKIIGIDLFVPLLSLAGRFLKHIPALSDFIFQTSMRAGYYLPVFSRMVVYVCKKNN